MYWPETFTIITIVAISVTMGWLACSLWIDWATQDAYDDGYQQGYRDAELDERVDSGQTYEAPF